jgi:hypothetical protein
LIRGSPTLLARSQEEPTYLIELTSEIAGGSRLFTPLAPQHPARSDYAIEPFLSLVVLG